VSAIGDDHEPRNGDAGRDLLRQWQGRKLVTVADEHSVRHRVVAKSGCCTSARAMIALSENENDGERLLHDDTGAWLG
jgi:hypothetical protein